MLQHYFKTAFREILTKKFYSIIVITGFSIGLSSWIFMMLWMNYESQKLGLNKKQMKVFRIGINEMEGSEIWMDTNKVYHAKLFPETPFPLGKYLMQHGADSIVISRFGYFNYKIVKSPYTSDVERRFAFADPEFFKFYNFPLVRGDISDFNKEKYSVIINKTTADKYFHTENPIGQTLNIDSTLKLKVIAVIKNIPSFYRIQFDIIAPIELVSDSILENNWTENKVNTYIGFSENTDVRSLYRKINDIIQENNPNVSEFYEMYPFVKYNNYSDIRADSDLGSDKQFIYIFSAIALYIILIACVNYFNISISTFANRAKEIAIRKTYGSRKRDIIIQFIIESQILAFISLIISFLLIKIFLPYFNSIASSEISLNITGDFRLLLKCILAATAIGLISSGFSAFYYAFLSPSKILSSSLKSGSKNINFVRFISYIQFTVSIAFMIATFKVDKQLNHLRNTKEGFEENYTLEIPINENINKNFNSFINSLKENLDILEIKQTEKYKNDFHLTNNAKSDYEKISVKIKPVRIPATIEYIEKKWKKFDNAHEFEYFITDSDFRKEFKRENVMGKLFGYFTFALVLVTSIGFFSFSSFVAAQRKFEIAIRKTYGATSMDIYFLLIKDFLLIALLSIITAHTMVFFTSISWLAYFTSRISEFGVSEYIIPTSIAIVVLILTVSYHSIRASLKSPAGVLRGE